MKQLAAFVFLAACGAAPTPRPQPVEEPSAEGPSTEVPSAPPAEEPSAEEPSAEEPSATRPVVVQPLPTQTPGPWAHHAARWNAAFRATRDVSSADVHPELGLGFALSNHEWFLRCPDAAFGERVEDTEDFYVRTFVIDDVALMVEGIELLDAESPAAFVCHPTWPACVQGSRLYVFADERLVRVETELDYNVGSYNAPEEREWILGEIERRLEPPHGACVAARTAAGSAP